MKFRSEVDIDLPRDEVVPLMENPDNMKHWQEGFISMTPIQGEPGVEGSKSRLLYRMGKREIEMVETIIRNELPDSLKMTYEAKGVFNVIENRFIPVTPSRTRWETVNEFRFSGFMRLFGLIMPGAFKKQSQKYLDDFKRFAEEGRGSDRRQAEGGRQEREMDTGAPRISSGRTQAHEPNTVQAS